MTTLTRPRAENGEHHGNETCTGAAALCWPMCLHREWRFVGHLPGAQPTGGHRRGAAVRLILALLAGLLAMFGQGDRETIEGAGCSGEVKAFDE